MLSSAVLFRLVAALGSAEAAWKASDEALAEVLKPKQVEKLNQTRQATDPSCIVERYQAMGIQAIPMDHYDYPDLLRQMHDPPFLLYVRGQIPLSTPHTLAVVGTRRYTDYGVRALQNFMADIAVFQPCIISGLAAGIDTVAHRCALIHDLPTIAVFGTGIDQVYPRENEKLALQIIASGGALISEYPAGVSGDRFTFPRRNRIIAALAQGTLVIEGDVTSGALITAKVAIEENRQVMALPGNIFNPTANGPNRLIQEGAYPVLKGEDIAQVLNWVPRENLSAEGLASSSSGGSQADLTHLNSHEREVLTAIAYEPTSLDEIQQKRKTMTIMDINTTLTMLELQGLITALPGSKFSRN